MLPVTTNEKYRAVLMKDEGMENPPTFLFPCLNGRQQRDVLLFKEGMSKGKTVGSLADFDAVFAEIESHLLGWENIEGEYSKGKLLDVISYPEALELLAMLTYQGPSIADKKKFRLPLPSDTEESVKPAKG